MRHTDLGHNLDVINVDFQCHSHQLSTRDAVTLGFTVKLFDQRFRHVNKNGPHRLSHRWKRSLCRIAPGLYSGGLARLLIATAGRC
jgi:hypothetical protein